MILQTNMKALLLVGAGGFAGSALRYLISRLMLPWAVSSGFPFSTLTVNVAGSLLIGALMGLGLGLALHRRFLRRVYDVFDFFARDRHVASGGQLSSGRAVYVVEHGAFDCGRLRRLLSGN